MSKVLSRLFGVVLALFAMTGAATAQLTLDITNWYYSTTDYNRSSQVYSTARGIYVNASDSAFIAWASLNPEGSFPILGAANNGSGAIRLTIGCVNTGSSNCPSPTSLINTSNYYPVANVGGTIEANGIWAVTVVDATHIDLTGSTFTHAYTSGGIIPGVIQGTTFANVQGTINNYNFSVYVSGINTAQGIPSYTGTSDITLTNPVPLIVRANFTGGHVIKLPQIGVPGGLPIGVPFIINNNATPGVGSAVGVEDSFGTLIANVSPGISQYFYLISVSNNFGVATGNFSAIEFDPSILNHMILFSCPTGTPNSWMTGFDAALNPQCLQPNFTNFAGRLAQTQAPTGGSPNQFWQTNGSGTATWANPASTNLSDGPCFPGIGMCRYILKTANLNVTTDQSITLTVPTGSTNYRVQAVLGSNPSISMTTAVCGIWTGAGKTGVTVMGTGAAGVAMSGLTTNAANTSGSLVNLTVNNTSTAMWTPTTLFFACSTAQGAAATADITLEIQWLN